MIDPDAVILLEGAALIIPECVLMCSSIGQFKRICQAEIFQFPEFRARLGQGKRVILPDGFVPAIFGRGDAIIVAAQHERLVLLEQIARMLFQRVHPFHLVVVFRTGGRIAIRQVQTAHAYWVFAEHQRLDIARLIVLDCGQALGDILDLVLGEQGDAIIAFLAQDGTVPAAFLQFQIGKRVGLALDFLEADDVAIDGVEDFQHCGKPCLDRVDIPCGDTHGCSLAASFHCSSVSCCIYSGNSSRREACRQAGFNC